MRKTIALLAVVGFLFGWNFFLSAFSNIPAQSNEDETVSVKVEKMKTDKPVTFPIKYPAAQEFFASPSKEIPKPIAKEITVETPCTNFVSDGNSKTCISEPDSEPYASQEAPTATNTMEAPFLDPTPPSDEAQNPVAEYSPLGDVEIASPWRSRNRYPLN